MGSEMRFLCSASCVDPAAADVLQEYEQKKHPGCMEISLQAMDAPGNAEACVQNERARLGVLLTQGLPL